MAISRLEKLLLTTVIEADSISLIKLRSSLGWDVSKFAETFISLEGKGFIDRLGAKVKITELGGIYYNSEVVKGGDNKGKSYRDEIEAPRINLSQPYLPNYEHFVAAKAKNLYT